MKLYLAAPWVDKPKMAELASKFEAHGHTITHRWWEVDNAAEGTNRNPELAAQAVHDLEGVKAADIIVVFNTAMSEGKAVEQGIALAYNKPIIGVGKLGDLSKNVFHYMINYKWVDDLDGAIEVLSTIKWLLRGADASKS